MVLLRLITTAIVLCVSAILIGASAFFALNHNKMDNFDALVQDCLSVEAAAEAWLEAPALDSMEVRTLDEISLDVLGYGSGVTPNGMVTINEANPKRVVFSCTNVDYGNHVSVRIFARTKANLAHKFATIDLATI